MAEIAAHKRSRQVESEWAFVMGWQRKKRVGLGFKVYAEGLGLRIEDG